MNSRQVVLYHGRCYDGFTAAWVAERVLRNRGPIEVIPMAYGDPLPGHAWDCHLYIVDFSFPREILERRARDPSHTLGVTDLLVLDHHKTAQAELEGLPFCQFDMDRSGAGLTWDYFHPGEKRPLLVEYVEDRDLWRFRLPSSREIAAWLRSWPFSLDVWDDASRRLVNNFEGIVLEGEAILRFQSQMVETMCEQAVWVELAGHRVPAANATVFFSEVGERLCELHSTAPFAAYWLDRADGKRQWGLRSRHGFDVSAIAKHYGGGGHAAAAGFTSDAERPR